MAKAPDDGAINRVMSTYTDPAGFSEWEATVPDAIRKDPIWKTPAYRYGLWLADLAAVDVAALLHDPDTSEKAAQLLSAAESISATLAEGYRRTTGPDRAKFYDYANGSAGECRDWYYKLRKFLPPDALNLRFELTGRLSAILNAVIPRERADRTGRARRKPKRLGA